MFYNKQIFGNSNEGEKATFRQILNKEWRFKRSTVLDTEITFQISYTYLKHIQNQNTSNMSSHILNNLIQLPPNFYKVDFIYPRSLSPSILREIPDLSFHPPILNIHRGNFLLREFCKKTLQPQTYNRTYGQF